MGANFKIHCASRRKRKGQAVIELALSLPFLILLLFFTYNAFTMLHTSHVGQRYAAMNLWMRVNNRTQFVQDQLAGTQVTRPYMAVQFVEPGDSKAPQRKIVRTNFDIVNIVGVCRETNCR